MAYGRYRRRRFRGRGRRRGGTFRSKRGAYLPSTRVIYARRTARAQAGQINSLKKAVAKINKKVLKYSQYKYGVSTSWSGVSDYHMSQWVVPTAWEKVFQSQDDDATQIKCRVLSLDFNMLIQAGSGFTVPAMISIFVVSVKKNIAQQFHSDTNSGANLVANEHYTEVGTGLANDNALVMLNKSIFNIHYYRKFMLGQSPFFQTGTEEEIYTTNIKDANRRFRYKHIFNKELKTDHSGTGDVGWKSLNQNDIAPNDMVFTYIFTNQPTVDSIYFDCNCLINTQTVV